jgi:hypothetical protein
MDPHPNWIGPLLISIGLFALSFATALAGHGIAALALMLVAFVFYEAEKDRREFQRILKIGRKRR